MTPAPSEGEQLHLDVDGNITSLAPPLPSIDGGEPPAVLPADPSTEE